MRILAVAAIGLMAVGCACPRSSPYWETPPCNSRCVEGRYLLLPILGTCRINAACREACEAKQEAEYQAEYEADVREGAQP